MRAFSLSRLRDDALLRRLSILVRRDCANLAALLAHIAEVDARRLYAPAGCSSMFAYCVERLHFSEAAAYHRIRAARAARASPALFAAVARGDLHLAAICLLAPHLSAANTPELIAAARRRSKAEVERWLAARFAGPVQELIAPCGSGEGEPATAGADAAADAAAGHERPPLAPGQVDPAGPVRSTAPAVETAAMPAVAAPAASARELAPGRVEAAASARAECARVALRVDLPLATQDKLRRAQALLSHALPSGDVATVLDRALDALLGQLERRKHATTSKPRPRRAELRPSRPPRPPRAIAAHVRRTVWTRDGGRCTFVGAAGERCGARRLLEYDHVRPVARGGPSTAANLRLRCRTHNRLEAERIFGAEFVHERRERARSASP